MLLSDSKKFIFFHLYKTAGTSLSRVLKHHATPHSEKHFSVGNYLKNYGRDIYEQYFTFGFVRNPWDWQVSLYHYMLTDRKHFEHKWVSSFESYEAYLDWKIKKDCKPQYIFFSENADLDSPISLDFVGRFENLEEDFTFLKSKLELKGKLPHLVKTNHKPYQEFYDPATKDMVAEAYHKDVSYFEYAF